MLIRLTSFNFARLLRSRMDFPIVRMRMLAVVEMLILTSLSKIPLSNVTGKTC